MASHNSGAPLVVEYAAPLVVERRIIFRSFHVWAFEMFSTESRQVEDETANVGTRKVGVCGHPNRPIMSPLSRVRAPLADT